ncbi:hypothetical protein ACLKA6_011651 [Drosophila palustris]
MPRLSTADRQQLGAGLYFGLASNGDSLWPVDDDQTQDSSAHILVFVRDDVGLVNTRFDRLLPRLLLLLLLLLKFLENVHISSSF